MAEKQLKTRIQLRYDTSANWIENDPVLKAGEAAIQTDESQVTIKIGDGVSTYTALPFLSGKAQDVYAWAKAETKPTYTKNEVGLGLVDNTPDDQKKVLSAKTAEKLNAQLTFTGAAEASFDGSKPVEVEVPPKASVAEDTLFL